MLKSALLLCGIFAATAAEARVFSFKDRRIAPFVRGSFAQSQLKQDAFADSSGSTTVLKGTVPWNYSGELGLAIGWSETFFMRLGLEMLRGSNSQVKGFSSTGVEWFTLDSSVFVFNPNIAFDYFYGLGTSSRFFTGLSVGMAAVTLENRYTMTTIGASGAGLNKPSYNEKAIGSSISATLSAGIEYLFLDNVTMMFDLGYRYLPISELTLTGPVNTIAQPSGAEGDVLKNSDGSTRSLNMGGIYTSLAFRFYVW